MPEAASRKRAFASTIRSPMILVSSRATEMVLSAAVPGGTVGDSMRAFAFRVKFLSLMRWIGKDFFTGISRVSSPSAPGPRLANSPRLAASQVMVFESELQVPFPRKPAKSNISPVKVARTVT